MEAGDARLGPRLILEYGEEDDILAALQNQIHELQAEVSALSQVVQIDPLTGVVVLSSPESLALDSGADEPVRFVDDAELQGNALLLQNATVMGITELEGDTMMMQNATVMGTTELEDDTMMMQNATVMGDTELEGDTMMMQNATVMGTTELEGDTMMMQNATVMGTTELEGDTMMMQNATVMGTTELEGDTMMMQNATVMGTTELEGNTMMLQNATVMGTTELEGNTMMLQNATVMGDTSLQTETNIQGTLVVTARSEIVADGVLTPRSTSVVIAGFSSTSGPPPPRIFKITPSSLTGTALELHFDVETFVSSCAYADIDSCLQAPDLANVVLGGSRSAAEDFVFQPGDTLSLVSDGDLWRESSRSGASTEVYTVTSGPLTIDSFPAGGQIAVDLNCTDTSVGGKAGGVLLVGGVQVISDPGGNLDVPEQEIEITGVDTEILSVVVRHINATGDDITFEVSARCILV